MSQKMARPSVGLQAGLAATGDPTGADLATEAAGPNLGARLLRVLGRQGLIVAFVLSVIAFGIAQPDSFLTWINAKTILTNAVPPLILAAALTFVLVMQDFDLSIGGMIGLSSGLAATLMVTSSWPWQLAVLVVIALCALAGAVTGTLVAVFGGNSFVITLAVGTVLTGLEYAMTDQKTIYSGFPEGFPKIATGELLGLSIQVWIAVVVIAAFYVLLEKSEYGRYMYAIGGSIEAARLSGLYVRLLRVVAFALMAAAAGLAGLLVTAQGASYTPGTGSSYLLPAFAAVFLGAAAFKPGQYNIRGTVTGVLFLAVIQTGLTMLNFQTYIINLVQGGILIIAVLISRLEARSK